MRPFPRSRRLRLGTRAALLWLLALVVPLQCSAALLRVVAGPAHVHAASASALPSPLLQDFRRGGARAEAASRPSALQAVIHGHSHVERHRHLSGGADTVILRDSVRDGVRDGVLDRADALDDGGTASSGAFAGLMPLLAAWPAWQLLSSAEALPAAAAWQPSSHVGTPLERPPRAELG